MLFNGEVAVVTGGAQGIGKAIAEELFREGAVAAILDIQDEKGEAAAKKLRLEGRKADFFHCDVSKPAEIERVVARVLEKYGRIDILVNNAGVLHSTPVEEITEEEWDRILGVNLKGTFFMVQKVLPAMRAQGRGKVVNISSLTGRMGGYASGMAYTASKAGIIGLTYGLARRLAGDNIKVNAVATGTTDTEILDIYSTEEKDALRQTIPLKRLGIPRDTAAAVAFLASSKADFITGAVLDVNGGMFTG